MTRKAETLEMFARRIETAILKAGHGKMDNLICRLLTGDDPKIAAVMAAKWVEWRYGKATEKHEHSGGVTVNLVNHIPRP